MEILYFLTNIVSALVYIAIVVVLFCWPPKPGRVLLVWGFSLQVLVAVYFAVQPLLFRYLNGSYGTNFWKYSQYVSQFLSLLHVIGFTLVLLGFIAILLDHKKQLAAGTNVLEAELVGGLIPHRSNMLLGLGISGLFFWPVALLVRYLAAKDLVSMKKDVMDPAGVDTAKFAYVLGSIGSVLLIGVGLTFVMIFIVLQFEMV